MEVRVKFYGNYRRLINTPEVTLEVEDEATPLHYLSRHGGECVVLFF